MYSDSVETSASVVDTHTVECSTIVDDCVIVASMVTGDSTVILIVSVWLTHGVGDGKTDGGGGSSARICDHEPENRGVFDEMLSTRSYSSILKHLGDK